MQNYIEQLKNYPMGPNLRKWFEISEDLYKGTMNSNVSDQEETIFNDSIIESFENRKIENTEHLTQIVDELVGMNKAMLALHVIDIHPENWQRDTFQRAHTEGIASMIAGELGRSELCFRYAQNHAPEEPASYVNLLRIFSQDNRRTEFDQWMHLALENTPNYHPLWETIYSDFVRQELDPKKGIENLLNQYKSWVGHSLLAEILENANSDTKSMLLEPFFSSGERSEEFLIEYTGALGQSTDFEKIPPIVWQYEKSISTQPHWRLKIHEAQAQLAMEQFEQFEKLAKLLIENDKVPNEVKDHLNELIKEQSEQE